MLVGHFNYDSKSYWASWASDEPALRNARWNWFTGRNYCRKMCMDMVSLETRAEENFVSGLMRSSNVQNIHTSGRLCDKEVEGCDAAHFKPLNINGWFWASTLKMMPPTNFVSNNAVVSLLRAQMAKLKIHFLNLMFSIITGLLASQMDPLNLMGLEMKLAWH